MANQTQPENPINWFNILFDTVGFTWGFILGGATGYFGNWLWEKFRPRKKEGHIIVEADSDGAYFSGRITPDNKDQILKTLKATSTPTSKHQTFGRSGTSSPAYQGKSSSTK